jgi:Phage gp6-like head-tail connector protein
MPDPLDLATLEDVRAWLKTGQNEIPPSDDDLLARLITSASTFIQDWLARTLVAAVYEELRDGLGGYGPARFVFANSPCLAVYQVAVQGLTIPPVPKVPPSPPGVVTALPLLSQSGYLFTPTELVIRGYFVPRAPLSVSLLYAAGYSPIPADVSQACIELVALKYISRSRTGLRSQQLPQGGSVNYITAAFSRRDISTDMQTILEKYKRVVPIANARMVAPMPTDGAIVAGAA